MAKRTWFDLELRRTWALFLAMAVFGLALGGYSFYRELFQRIRVEKHADLAGIGALKCNQIAQWRKERMGDAISVARSPLLAPALEEWLQDPERRAKRDELIRRLELTRQMDDYASAFLLDTDGRVLLEATGGPGPTGGTAVATVNLALTRGQGVFSDLFRLTDGTVYIDVIVPVLSTANRPMALVVLRSNAHDFLYPLIDSWPVPSQSAETVLVQKEGDDVLFLSELRHRPGAELSLRIPLTQTDVPAVQAALGRRAMFEGKDYRGVDVLADLRAVPDSPWFMVAKIDTAEIYASMKYLTWATIAVVVLLIALTAAMIAFFYRQRQVRIYRIVHAAEQEAHKTHELLRATLVGIGDGVLATDEQGRIVFVNPVAQTLTGWTQTEALGKPLVEVLHVVNAMTRSRCEDPVQKVLANGEVVGLANHTVLIARDGTERQIADSGAPIRDRDGNVIGVVLVFRDVTDEYRMRESLAISETRYRRLFESAKDGILILDAETGAVTDANPFLAELLGCPREQLLGKTIWDLGLFKEITASKADFLTLKQVGYVRDEDLSLETADGHPIGVELIGNVYQANQRKVIQYNIRDVSERKRAEAAIEASRDYIANIVNAIGDPVFVKDEQHRFVLVNDAETALMGRSREELVGHTDADFLPSEQVNVFWQTDDEVLASGGESVHEECLTDIRTGETRIIVTRKTRYVDPNAQRFIVGVIRDITERKQAEEALRRSEGQVRAKLDAILLPDGDIGMLELTDIFDIPAIQHLMDEFGRLTHMTVAILDLSGNVLVATGWQDICTKFHRIHPETAVYCTESDVLLSAGVMPGTWKMYQCKNHMRDVVTPITVGGRHVGNLFLGQFLFDDEPRDYELFRSQAQRYGFSEDEYIAAYERVPRWSREGVDAVMRFYMELAEIVARLSYSNLRLARSLTERQQAEAALRESEVRYRTVADFTYDWEYWVGPDGHVIYCSPACERITGYRAEEFEKDPDLLISITHPDDRVQVVRHHADDIAVDDTEPHELEFRVLTRSGDVRWITHACRSVRGHDGAYMGRRASNRDVTQRKQGEDAQARLESQLRQAQKMESVGQLAGGIAHDFNNLLQVILGYVGVLESGLRKRPCYSEPLDAIRQAAERAAELTRQLLAFSRRQIIQPVNLNMNDLVHGVLKMIRRVIGENIELRYMPGEHLGTVRVDKGQIEQILMNLCVNARDAMPDGGTLTIETENVIIGDVYCREHPWATEGRYVLLSVTDTGHGMDQATREQIFEPFFTTKDLGHGTGLGLATVYGIVKQHHGLIHVYSEKGKGSVFKVYIPIVERLAEVVGTKIEERVVGGNETILVAEDEDAVRRLVTRLLTEAGYTVLPACDGEEALRLFEEHADAIDMALLDVMMPKVGGREVMDRIQGKCPRVRFLFSSGYSENAIHVNFVMKEGLHLITKPYHADDLLRAIRRALDGKKRPDRTDEPSGIA